MEIEAGICCETEMTWSWHHTSNVNAGVESISPLSSGATPREMSGLEYLFSVSIGASRAAITAHSSLSMSMDICAWKALLDCLPISRRSDIDDQQALCATCEVSRVG